MEWAYGVTTVPERRGTLLPKTLASLEKAGFENPTLFVDGVINGDEYRKIFRRNITVRYPKISGFGNWQLGMMELVIRNPTANRFAIFQDDFVTYVNLRKYLDRTPYPESGYWNLYTFPSNQQIVPEGHIGWHLSNQSGRGAVGLVFDRDTVMKLLAQPHFVERPICAIKPNKSIDGCIVTALAKVGVKEYIHSPSLVQHTGTVSTLGNSPHKQAPYFMGENFDALELLNKK